jgi:hypothetical protein
MYHLDIGGEEATHTLLPEAALERAHGVWMRVGFLRPLPGGAISKQHQRADHLIAPLDLIHEAHLQWHKLCGRSHRCPHPSLG